MPPFPDPGKQPVAVDLHAGVSHTGIVESPSLSTTSTTATTTWPDEAATARCAATLARQSGLRNAYVELHGELGAGKTTFVRHLLRALGVQGRIKSPTYAVVEPYTLARTADGGNALDIWHFDFYRFSDPREWEDAGLRDIFASPGLKIAEWPEKAAGALPVADLQAHIRLQDEDARAVAWHAGTARGAELLKALAA